MRINITRQTLFALSLILSASSVYAGYSDEYYSAAPSRQKSRQWKTVIAIGGGSAITRKAGESSTFPIRNPITDSFYNYSAERSSQTAKLYTGFLGVELPAYETVVLQGGLSYQQTALFPVKGSLTQGADVPSQDQYNYRYNILSRLFILEGKALFNYHYLFFPYLTAGVGLGFNKSYGFGTDIPPNETFTRDYTSHTNVDSSYTLGGGIDIGLGEEVRIGAGYRYVNAGEVKLGGSRIDNVGASGTLLQSNLYLHEFYGQLTFLF